MGFIAPIIGVASTVGGIIGNQARVNQTNEANRMQIEANRREEQIRLMDLESQRQSNRDDFELSSQQRIADLAASLTKIEIDRLDSRTQGAIRDMQITSAQSGIDVGALQAESSRESQFGNALAEAAMANGIDINGIDFEQLNGQVISNRSNIFAALSPQFADLYRNDENKVLLDQYDKLVQAQGDQNVSVGQGERYAELVQQFADNTLQSARVSDGLKQSSAQNALSGTKQTSDNARNTNDSLSGIMQEMSLLGTQIEQLGAYKNLVGGENSANAQAGNIRSATSNKNTSALNNNRPTPFLEYASSLFNSVSPLMSLFNSPQQPSQPANPLYSDSRYDTNYRPTLYNTTNIG